MVGLAFAVAASVNFPVLLMSMFWRGTTTFGAFVGGILGLVTSVVGVVISDEVWVKTLGNPEPIKIFGYGMIDNPALYSMAAAFIGIWLFSMIDRIGERQRGARSVRRAIRALGNRHRRVYRAHSLNAKGAGIFSRPSFISSKCVIAFLDCPMFPLVWALEAVYAAAPSPRRRRPM